MKRGAIIALAIISSLFLLGFIAAQDSEGTLSEWRMFGRWLNHTNYDGISYSIPSSVSSNGVFYNTGGLIFSSAAIVNGFVYYEAYNGSSYYLFQANASNVSQLISSLGIGDYGLASPAVLNGYVYAGGGNNFYQLNASNVSQIIGNYSGVDRFQSSPAVAGGFVYVGSEDNKVYQLNASNVSQLFASYTAGNDVDSSPAVANGFVYVGSSDGQLYQLNASNISIKYTNYSTGNAVYGYPSVYNGFVYVTSANKALYQLNASNVSIVYANYTTAGQIFYSSPAIANGFAYFGSNDDKVYQVNASNVSQLYATYTTQDNVRASPTVANGFVYVGGLDDKIYQLNASNISLFVGSYTTGSDVYSTPAYAQGFIYFGSYDGKFYQVNASNLSKIEFVLPSITINSPMNTSYTASAVSVNASISELATCNYSIGGNTYNLSSGPAGLNFGVDLSLTQGSYTLNVQCWDLQGNSNYSTISFSVVSPDSGSSGGGGSSGNFVKAISQTDFEQGINIELLTTGKASFMLGTSHTLTLNYFNTTDAKITVNSNPIVAWLGLNEEKRLDVDGDGIEDILIRYNGVSGYKASLFLQKIASEDVQNSEVNENGQITSASQNQDNGNNYTWIIIVVAVIVALAVGKGLMKRKNYGYPKDLE